MTNKEAINYLRGCLAPTCDICSVGCQHAELGNDARDLATKSLEKQIPKKPIHSRCSNCGTSYSHITDNLWNPNGHKVIYCWNCGQALDRSEND